MGKRLLDSSLFGSPSLAQCSPRAQDAFPRFILLADDFGCFHANPRVLLGRGWPLREDVTEEEIRAWMEEYIAAGMLRVWEEQGRVYAYLTGWDGEHGQKKRTEYHPDTNKHGSKRHAPVPPAADSPKCLKTLPARETGGKTPGNDREETGNQQLPGEFPSTQSQFLSQAQPHDLAGLAPDPKRPTLRLTPTPKEKVRQPSRQELLAQRIAEQRAAILGGEPLPDESFGVSRLNQMLAPLLEVEEGLLSRAHALFCEDPWVRNEANPPAPLRLFAAQWSKWVALAMKRGVPA